jgi:hypothetical protein
MVAFIATLAVIPLLVVRIPEDYFINEHRLPWPWSQRHPALHVFLIVLKNLLGLFFLASGFLMLFMPGQGIITMLLGLTFMNFPGKRRLEKAVIRQRAVYRSINWLRVRRKRAPLQVPARPSRA